MSSSKPTILFLHGSYHLPACYNDVLKKLEAAGHDVVAPQMASLGHGARGITLDDDVAVVRKTANTLFEAGKEVVLVGHSYGGFVAMIAAEKLGTADLRGQGKEGSFKAIVYLSALLVNRGELAITACNPGATSPPDVTEVFDIVPDDDGKISATLKSSEPTYRYFFSPAPKEQVKDIYALLRPQCPDVFYQPSPVSPSDLGIAQTYIIAEKDQMVLLAAQEQIVSDNGIRAVRLPDSGHAPFITHQQQVVDTIVEAASA